MKKFSKSLVFLLILTSIILPVIPVAFAQEDEVPPYRVASFQTTGDWDWAAQPG
ncbi:MAG: hypothetical protein ACXABO_19550 [Promethearchaeota archaeon]|jgi:hypothetical protein